MCESILKKHISEYKTAKVTYQALKTQYFDSGFTTRYTLLIRLFTINMNNFDIDANLEAYIEAHHQIKKNLKNLDNIFFDWAFCEAFFFNLNDRYSDFVNKVILKNELFIWDQLTTQLRKIERHYARNKIFLAYHTQSTNISDEKKDVECIKFECKIKFEKSTKAHTNVNC